MSDHISQQKRAARARIKDKLERVGNNDRSTWSAKIASHVEEMPSWRDSGSVLGFLPMGTEVDTTGIINAALSQNKVVGVPRMYGEVIKFHQILTMDGPFDSHPYGLLEPKENSPLLEPEVISRDGVFVITPGLCFDPSGGRIGFGRGYYDRYITLCRSLPDARFFFCGVSFSLQLENIVPTGTYDCRLDALATEKGVQYFTSD